MKVKESNARKAKDGFIQTVKAIVILPDNTTQR
jgi:hypothetical protein